MGSIGNDRFGKQLLNHFKNSGIIDCLYVHDKLQTGICAVLINGINRCLVPSLGAAFNYPYSQIDEKWEMIENADRYYATSYFLETNYKAVKKTFEFGAEEGRPIYYNLAAKKWIHKHHKDIFSILPNVEGIIGNAEEVIELASIINSDIKDIKDAVGTICKIKLVNKRQKRFVVATNANNPIVIGELKNGNVEIVSLETPKVEEKKIKTTNGAGDTLAGGLFAGQIMGFDLINSIKLGQKMAYHYVQQTDQSYPKIQF